LSAQRDDASEASFINWKPTLKSFSGTPGILIKKGQKENKLRIE
jgi:hypothetical protein